MSNLENSSAAHLKTWVVANFKMNGDRALFQSICADLQETLLPPSLGHLILCPPFPYLPFCQGVFPHMKSRLISLGAQDCSAHDKGAFTGEVSAQMLKEFGCEVVILGHSERRRYHQEHEEEIAKKIHQALSVHLRPLICVGEPTQVRQSGQTIPFILQQIQALLSQQTHSLQHIIIAYEPLWAIGTGVTPTLAELSEVLGALEKYLNQEIGIKEPVILYGGSVTAQKIPVLLSCPFLRGLLVGKACLKNDGLTQLMKALRG